MEFSSPEEEYYYYNTAPAAVPIPPLTPYQQYLQSRGTWQLGDHYDTESWLMMQDEGLISNDHLVAQRHALQTRQRDDGERLADSALSSWKIERIGHRSRPSVSRLSLSTTRGSTSELKEFLHSRGKVKIEGLHLAAARSDVSMITNIIKREGRNVRINELDENECTPLMYAVLADSIQSLELLLHCGAKREEVDSNGRTAVHYAAFFGKAKALKFLIESAAHWMPRDVYGRTPLHWSAVNKDTKCLQVLLKHSIVVMGNMNVRDYEGMSPLHCAAQYCRPKHVQVLYEANCDFTITDIEGKTALHWTTTNPDSSCIEALVSCFPSLLNVKDNYGQTILHITAKAGAVHLLETLLTYEGIEIDAKEGDERTALHVAAMAGQPGSVQLLLLHNALDSCIDASGQTALHYAVLANSSECVQQFVFGSSITHVPSADDSSQTPLMLAASSGQNDLVKLLVANQKIEDAIDQTDPQGKSALHLACEAGAGDCIGTLVGQGADHSLLDKAGRAPLKIVCDAGFADCIGPLVEGGADIQLSSQDNNYSYLHEAVRNGHTSVVERLVEFGAAVEMLDNSGNTPLQLAISLNLEDIVRVLLDKGADPNSLNLNGLTGLHLAAGEGYLEILKLLLEQQGFVNNMDGTSNRYTPLDYAERNSHSECANLLLQYGGITMSAIENIAVTCIQNAYRNYRARKQLKTLRDKTRAAILIQHCVRGFLVKRWYIRTITEVRAAVKLQALVRGFLQRQKFEKLLKTHRIRESHWKVIETFDDLVQNMKVNGTIKPILLSLKEQKESLDVKKGKVDEQTRRERSLQMREVYIEKQKNWKLFRQAEKQRRIDKAHQEKMDYMNGVLKGKQERREHFEEHFQHTANIRSHFQAASLIQRTYRQYRERKSWWKRMEEARFTRNRVKEMLAASIIQNTWRRYNKWKRFEATHMYSVYTSPVVQLAKRPLPSQLMSSKETKSYERSTITSGIGRRKLNQTKSGGFKVFKPIPTIAAEVVYTPHTHLTSLKESADHDSGKLRRKQSNRMKDMRVHWPWAEELLRVSEEGEGGTERSSRAAAPVYSSHGTFIVKELKLPQIN